VCHAVVRILGLNVFGGDILLGILLGVLLGVLLGILGLGIRVERVVLTH
jgi:hypothetical protein